MLQFNWKAFQVTQIMIVKGIVSNTEIKLTSSMEAVNLLNNILASAEARRILANIATVHQSTAANGHGVGSQLASLMLYWYLSTYPLKAAA